MDGRLKGKVAVVTGGASGIGQAFCLRLAQEGAAVAIADVADARETVDLIRRHDGVAWATRCDQTSPRDIEALRAGVTETFGAADILVHCAGIYPMQPFENISFYDWQRVMSVNVDSAYHLSQAFLPVMKKKGWGRIVCVASAAFHGGVGGCSHYVASKGALIGFARSLASEVGEYGVTVNLIAPGLVRTKTTENGIQQEQNWFEALRQQQCVKRVMVPADLAGPLAFLASDDSAFVTGQTLLVDGGWRFS